MKECFDYATNLNLNQKLQFNNLSLIINSQLGKLLILIKFINRYLIIFILEFLLKFIKKILNMKPEAELKKFESRLKYGWFHLKLYLIFQDLSRRSIKTGFVGFETRLKFIKFGHCNLF